MRRHIFSLFIVSICQPVLSNAFLVPVGGGIQKQRSDFKAAVSKGNEESKCPVTKFGKNMESKLQQLDSKVLSRVIRIANHVPTAATLGYFAIVSMASMNMGPLCTSPSSLPCALTQQVGPTTNELFAKLFPTLVTPASFVFLVWPVIALLQTITLAVSAFFPTSDEILTQSDLSSLSMANLAATAWLVTSSNAKAGALPLASVAILPLVPILSGFSLRNTPKYILWSNQVFSSFTTIAACLAFSIELQYGGRIPLIEFIPPELAGITFLSLYSATSLAVQNKSGCKRIVNFIAFTGIVVKRFLDVMAGSFHLSGIMKLASSITFLGSIGCWIWSFNELFPSKKKK